MIDTDVRKHVQSSFDLLAKKSLLVHLHPNFITTLGLLTGVTCAVLIGFGHLWEAFILLWVSGLLDVLDGTVARITGKTSSIGAYLDLIFDRVVEGAIIFSFYFIAPQFAIFYFVFFMGAMFNFTTFMLAGTLFKNTGKKSMHYDIGLVERTESFITFGLMMLFPAFIPYILGLFNFLMILTGIIRIYRIIKHEAVN